MAQADKKLKSFGFFGNKYEEASELLEKAANNYKLGKVRSRVLALFAALRVVCVAAPVLSWGLEPKY